jgi:hypothetical protein
LPLICLPPLLLPLADLTPQDAAGLLGAEDLKQQLLLVDPRWWVRLPAFLCEVVKCLSLLKVVI